MRLLVIALVLACLFAGCGVEEHSSGEATHDGPVSGQVSRPNDHVEIIKTSSNTYEIWDDETWPNRYLDKTCQTDGSEVASVNTPGEAYEYLLVVCGPHSDTAPLTENEDEDTFSP